jgi:predicted RND superfamily exporter protein
MEKLYKYPVVIAGLIAAVTIFFVTQLPKVRLDNNNMRFLPDKNQARIIGEYIDEEFGGQVVIFVGLERPYSTVFDKGFLRQIRDFSLVVEGIELVKTVNSLMSTQYITSEGDSIIVSDLVSADFSGTQEEIAELRRRIASWDLFKGSLVSDDLSATQILITLDALTVDASSPEVSGCFRKIRDLAGEIFAGEAKVYFAGQTVLNTTINESIIADNLLLLPLAIIVVLGLLFFSFRRLIFVVLPLLTAITAVVWTLGLTGLIGLKLSTITTIMPIILIAVGHAYGIHVITHYVKDTREKILSPEEHRLVVIDIMGKMLRPVFLAAVTTIIGFISFCFTPIVPMREFGLYTSAGVLSVFILTMMFIPALLLLRGPRNSQLQENQQTNNDRFSNTITNIFLGIAKREKLVFFSAVLIVIISMYGFSKIIVDNSVVDFFQKETDMSRSDRFIREHFGGSKELNLVVLSDSTEELLHPDVLSAVDGLSVYLTENVPAVGKVVGFTDVIKRINQVWNADQSPEGLQPVAAYTETGNFGFGDFGFFEDGYEDDYLEKPGQENNHDLTLYSAADILRFFDRAAGMSTNLSGGDLVRELKRLTNYDGMAYYEIPANPVRYGKETPEELQRIIANYLVLLSGDVDSGYSNDPFEPTAIRMMIQLRTTGNQDTQAVIDIINEYVSVNFPQNVSTIIGGSVTQEMAVTELILNSQIISIFISVFMIFLIVALSHKSTIAGVISAVPLILAVLCNFTVMGLFGIKLNLGTALIASLTVCIGIDDAIHFIEFFKKEYRKNDPDSLRRTFIACGKAICITALSVGAGFAVLAFSRFKIIAEFGMLTAICMLSTTLVSLTVIPAMLTTIKPKFVYGEKK